MIALRPTEKVPADTSVWVEHFRRHNARLAELLEADSIVMHDFVVGELVLGGMPRGHRALELLGLVARASHPEHEETLAFVRHHRLEGRGVGWVDCTLLAAAAASGASLWTLDRHLALAATAAHVPLE